MAANAELKVRCPSCGAKYKLPASAVGRKVRCAKCQATFRVTDPRADSHRLPSPGEKESSARSPAPQNPGGHKQKGYPSEDDILRWLAEADDDAGHERRGDMSVDDRMTAGHQPATSSRQSLTESSSTHLR